MINNLYEANGIYYVHAYIGNYFADLYHRNNGGTERAPAPAAASSAGTRHAQRGGHLPVLLVVRYAQGFGLTPKFGIVNTLDYGFFAQDNWKITVAADARTGRALRL